MLQSQQPVVIKVKIDDLRITEIDVDLSSKESFYGQISYKVSPFISRNWNL